MLGQALGNLVENALRHAQDGSLIALGVTRERGTIVISVADDGPGIPAARREDALRRFGRLDREAVEAADRKRVLSEQFVLLAQARGQWQEVERRALQELEDLTRALRQKEQEHAAREAWLVRSDARRREEGYDLWQLRLRLEAWQSKLVTTDRRWHQEREARDADYARRLHALLERERGGPLGEFAVAGADRKWHWATARIEGDTVVLSSPDVPQPVAVRYAWQSNPVATLTNGVGLPAVPFRTDDWPGVTVGRK